HTASTYTEKTSVSRIRKIRYKPGSKPDLQVQVKLENTKSTNRGLCGKSLIIDKQVFREKHLRVNRSQSRKCVTSVVLSASIKQEFKDIDQHAKFSGDIQHPVT
ncbi:hypothetical protein PV326_004076, partial [Microctonus aethiopoides]